MIRFYKSLLKYLGIFLLATFGAFVIGWGLTKLTGLDDNFKNRVLPPVAKDEDAAQLYGGGEDSFRNQSLPIPSSLEDELDAKPIQMIPERQVQPMPVQEISQEDRESLGEIVDAFLIKWETYAASEGYTAYAKRLAPYTTPDRLEDISRRLNNHGPRESGPCQSCSVGSILNNTLVVPSQYMIVRRFDDESAWVTTQGDVTYITSQLQAGQVVRRSYSLVLEKQGSEWRVSRVIADTLDVHTYG